MDNKSINIGTENDPLYWSEGICEDCMCEDGTAHCSCGCLVCADCKTDHDEEGYPHDGPRDEIRDSPEAMTRRATYNIEGGAS